MLFLNPFPYLKRKIACDAKSRVQRLAIFQIWLVGINGSLILIAAIAALGTLLGFIEPHHFPFLATIEPHQLMIVGAFLIGLQIILCWLLSISYKLQEKIRLLSVVNTALYFFPALAFLSLQYSPQVPIPIFSF